MHLYMVGWCLDSLFVDFYARASSFGLLVKFKSCIYRSGHNTCWQFVVMCSQHIIFICARFKDIPTNDIGTCFKAIVIYRFSNDCVVLVLQLHDEKGKISTRNSRSIKETRNKFVWFYEELSLLFFYSKMKIVTGLLQINRKPFIEIGYNSFTSLRQEAVLY